MQAVRGVVSQLGRGRILRNSSRLLFTVYPSILKQWQHRKVYHKKSQLEKLELFCFTVEYKKRYLLESYSIIHQWLSSPLLALGRFISLVIVYRAGRTLFTVDQPSSSRIQ
jgi:hypothetical protein